MTPDPAAVARARAFAAGHPSAYRMVDRVFPLPAAPCGPTDGSGRHHPIPPGGAPHPTSRGGVLVPVIAFVFTLVVLRRWWT